MSQPEPIQDSSLLPIKTILRSIDEDIHTLYREHAIPVSPRFSMALMKLADDGPCTIKALAHHTGVTHSAMSQAVALLNKERVTSTREGQDRREKQVFLTPRGRALIPFLQAEWQATERAIQAFNSSLSHSLLALLREAQEKLAREPIIHTLRKEMESFK
jgi:DNA-binding MarR family transcriptional regulator